MKTEQLVHFISQFLSVQIFDKNDIIYTFEEKAEMIYIILRGNVGIYEIEFTYEEMTFWRLFIIFIQRKKLYDIKKS